MFDFYILIGQFLDTYHKGQRKMVRACITHLRLFTRKRKSLPVTLLTKDFCINFLEYLKDHLGTLPSDISRNSECALINV